MGIFYILPNVIQGTFGSCLRLISHPDTSPLAKVSMDRINEFLTKVESSCVFIATVIHMSGTRLNSWINSPLEKEALN